MKKTASAGVTLRIETPTLDKMLVNKKESQAIGQFIEWLSEKGFVIGTYEKIEGYREEQFVPTRHNIEKMLALYFDIDLDAAERERVKILNGLRVVQS